MKPRNLRQLKKLIRIYESITVEQIESTKEKDMFRAARRLTGFGSPTKCILCRHTRFESCEDCVHVTHGSGGCMREAAGKTYYDIYEAKTPKQLLKAFQARAEYLKSLLTG